VANPDRPNAATIMAAALADGAEDFFRNALPKGEAASFFSEVVRALDEHIERERLAAEQRECERLVVEQREREQRERERLALEQRSPICLLAVMPVFVRRPLRARVVFVAARAGLVAATRRAARPSRAARRSRPAPGFFEKVERELDKLGNSASMTPTELAEHVDRILVAPLGKLNLAQAAAVVRAAFHPPGARAPHAVAPHPARYRQRGVRNRRHRVAGRGPRAPATVDAPPEPPTERQVAAELRGSRKFGENPRFAVALATARAEVAP
jgi:hypothetical protein